MYSIRPIETDDVSLLYCANFLANTFGRTDLFTLEYLQWLYRDCPSGSVLGYNAWFGDELVAHYPVLPIDVNIFGALRRGVISINNGTRLDHRRKGLMRNLAMRTISDVQTERFEFALAITNGQSTPVYLIELQFRTFGSLDALVSLRPRERGCPLVDYDFYFNKNPAIFEWRMKRPGSCYRSVSVGSGEAIVASTQLPRVFVQLAAHDASIAVETREAPCGAYVWLGIDSLATRKTASLNIPRMLRPSPLNFVFRSFSSDVELTDEMKFYFEGMDFDAF